MFTAAMIEQMSIKMRCVLSVVFGLLLVLAYAPFGLWGLAIILPICWLKLLQNQTSKNATKMGFCFGLGWFIAGISWVHVSIDQFGGLPLIVSLLLMLLLCAYLAIYPALACYLAARFSHDRKFSPWLLPITWLLAEYLRSTVLTGFPWLSLGYSQIDSPMAALAPLIGEIGITFLLWVIAVSVHQIMGKNAVSRHLALLGIIAITLTFCQQTVWVTPQHKTIKTALIQGNIKQEMRWVPEQEWPTMLKYSDLTRQHYDADLIIWPESAVPSIEPMSQEYLNITNSAATLNNTAIITGIINYNFESKKYFNSLIVLGNKHINATEGDYFYNNGNRYYKHHLLPIGEFVPFQQWLRPIAPFFNLPMSSFSRGSYVQPNLIAQDLHIAPLICFEIAFPEQLAANFNRDTDLLMTVSNDAWFGNSHGPHQHLEMARMRALEFGRPMLRATNNGITAVIDYQGNVINQLPQFEQAVLRSTIPLVKGLTPYSRWHALIHWAMPLSLLLLYVMFSRKTIYRQNQALSQ